MDNSYEILALDALKDLRRKKTYIDRGNEFKNKTIEEFININNIERSLSHKGTPLDNAVIESLNHVVKTEFINTRKFYSLEELRIELFDYVHWYNYERIHGYLGYDTPIKYRYKHDTNIKTNLQPLVFLQNASGTLSRSAA